MDLGSRYSPNLLIFVITKLQIAVIKAKLLAQCVWSIVINLADWD